MLNTGIHQFTCHHLNCPIIEIFSHFIITGTYYIILGLIVIELLLMLNKEVKRLLECIAYKHVFETKVIECIYVTIYLILCIFYVN